MNHADTLGSGTSQRALLAHVVPFGAWLVLMHFLDVRGLTPAALEAVSAYRWPGNLTELRRTLASARAHTTQELIDLPDLPFALRQARLNEQEPTRPAPRNLPLEETLAEVERRLIRLALRRARGNRSRAAELLGIHRPRLARRMESLGLEEPGLEGE